MSCFFIFQRHQHSSEVPKTSKLLMEKLSHLNVGPWVTQYQRSLGIRMERGCLPMDTTLFYRQEHSGCYLSRKKTRAHISVKHSMSLELISYLQSFLSPTEVSLYDNSGCQSNFDIVGKAIWVMWYHLVAPSSLWFYLHEVFRKTSARMYEINWKSSLTHSFIHSLTHSLTHLHSHSFSSFFVHSFIHYFIHYFIQYFVHFIGSSYFIHSFIHSFNYSFSHSFIYSIIHSTIPLFIHLFIHSLIQSFLCSFFYSFI